MAITNNPHASWVYSECERFGRTTLIDFARTLAPLPLPDGWMINQFNPGSSHFGASVRGTLGPPDGFHDAEKMILRGHVAQFIAPGNKRIDIEAIAEMSFDLRNAFTFMNRPKTITSFVMYTQTNPKGQFFYQSYPDRDTLILAMLAMGADNV